MTIKRGKRFSEGPTGQRITRQVLFHMEDWAHPELPPSSLRARRLALDLTMSLLLAVCFVCLKRGIQNMPLQSAFTCK